MSALFRAEVAVTLKPVVNDPQGLVVRDALRQLGYAGVRSARVGKVIDLQLEAPGAAEARAQVVEMCERLLRNPVIEDYHIESVDAVADARPDVRFGIAVFPGTWSDRDCAHAVSLDGHEAVMLWHRDGDLRGVDCVILPGGFSYGDYLRCGAVARFAPLMDSVAEFARAGGLVWGICNGFQILCEAHLLPGALVRNASLQFRCEPSWLRVETTATPYTASCRRGDVLQIPVSHGEGRYVADEATLDVLEEQDRVALRYVAPDGAPVGAASPNGSMRDIAGIVSEGRNVLGMMPHPERACEPLLGSADGMALVRSVATALARSGGFAAGVG